MVVKDTQLEPDNGAAHAALPIMFCVGPALVIPKATELFVVVVAELSNAVTVSALAVINAPLTATSNSNFLIILRIVLVVGFVVVVVHRAAIGT